MSEQKMDLLEAINVLEKMLTRTKAKINRLGYEQEILLIERERCVALLKEK